MSKLVTPDDYFKDQKKIEDRLRRIEQAQLGRLPLVTALPQFPEDGDIIHYDPADSVAGQSSGIVWPLRFRGKHPDGTPNTSAYKWEALGAGPLILTGWSGSQAAAVNGGYIKLPNSGNGTSLVLPLAGDWEVVYFASGQIDNVSAVSNDTYIAVHTSGNVQLTTDTESWSRSSGNAFDKWARERTVRLNGVAASTRIDVRGKMNGTGSATWTFAQIAARPIRVG